MKRTYEEMLEASPEYDPTFFDRVKCALGFHDYGEPQVMRTVLGVSGERTDDGWETEVDDNPDPDEYVEQHCLRRGCYGSKKRPDLDPDEVRENRQS